MVQHPSDAVSAQDFYKNTLFMKELLTKKPANALLVIICLGLPSVQPAASESEATGPEAGRAAYQAKDYVTALSIFKPLAESGDARSQAIVALMYRYGEGVDKDPVAASQWYEKAAEQRFSPAQYSLADMLLSGEGIPRDEDAGLYWMELAAQSGHERAINYLQTSGPVAMPGAESTWSKAWDLRLPNRLRFETAPPDASYRLQLGVVTDLAAAQALWQGLQARHAGQLTDLSPEYWRDALGNDTRFHIQAGQYARREAAQAVCQTLRPDHCRVVYR